MPRRSTSTTSIALRLTTVLAITLLTGSCGADPETAPAPAPTPSQTSLGPSVAELEALAKQSAAAGSPEAATPGSPAADTPAADTPAADTAAAGAPAAAEEAPSAASAGAPAAGDPAQPAAAAPGQGQASDASAAGAPDAAAAPSGCLSASQARDLAQTGLGEPVLSVAPPTCADGWAAGLVTAGSSDADSYTTAALFRVAGGSWVWSDPGTACDAGRVPGALWETVCNAG